MTEASLPYEGYLDDLERDLAGLRHRLLELEGMAGAHPDQIVAQKEAIAAAEDNLRRLSKGQKTAAKRPRQETRETRG